MSTDIGERDETVVSSVAEDGITAQLRLDHPDLLLRPSIDRAPEVTVEPDHWTTVDDGRAFVFLEVTGEGFEGFERALGTDHTVANPVLVDRAPDRRVYRVERTDRAIQITGEIAAVGGRLRSLSSSFDGWTLQVRLPGRDALVSFNDYCRRLEISVTVDHLRPADASGEVVALTEKQRELLTVAAEEGYFDVPRRISQHELAERLDVSKSAVSQRLRRAVARLCDASLS